METIPHVHVRRTSGWHNSDAEQEFGVKLEIGGLEILFHTAGDTHEIYWGSGNTFLYSRKTRIRGSNLRIELKT